MFHLTTDKDRIALIVALAALLAQPAVKAQAPANTVVANIPFAFQIGSSHLAPGKYRLQMEGDHLLLVRGDSGAAVLIVENGSANRPSADSAVVFHHYGNQYFLREVRTAGNDDYLWCGESKAEHRAKMEEEALNPNSGPREGSKVEIALLAPPR